MQRPGQLTSDFSKPYLEGHRGSVRKGKKIEPATSLMVWVCSVFDLYAASSCKEALACILRDVASRSVWLLGVVKSLSDSRSRIESLFGGLGISGFRALGFLN